MARPSGLDKMSLKDLLKLQERVADALVARKDTEKQELKSKLAALAASSGFDLSEIFGGKGGKRGKAAAKYRNPANPSETWAGRGRQPLWLVAALKKGAKLDSFAV